MQQGELPIRAPLETSRGDLSAASRGESGRNGSHSAGVMFLPDDEKPLRMDSLQWPAEVRRGRGEDMEKAGKLHVLIKRSTGRWFPLWLRLTSLFLEVSVCVKWVQHPPLTSLVEIMFLLFGIF